MLKEEKRLQDLTDAGEQKVAAMLGSLARVEAPGDFNAHVRARIAKGQPATARTSWFPGFARIAAPALVLTAVGGYLGYNALYQDVDLQPVAGVEAPAVVPATQPTVENVVVPAPTTEVAVGKPPVNSSENVAGATKKPANSNKATENPGGGSVDLALRETNSVSPTLNSKPTIPAATLSVREVFSSMGIRASHSGAGWRVSSASGRAAAAGLQTGDIIESVNGKPVGANTVFDANFAGRSILVKRDGASIQISL